MTSEPRLIRCDDVAPQPWRNGGGRTRELLAGPDAVNWRYRISVAAIDADGPFSSFDDVRRWFTVLRGAGVELEIDGRAQRLVCGDAPLQFSGAAATTCRLLAGPTLDLNLMLRGVGGRMSAATSGIEWQPRAGACGLFTACAGVCRSDGLATPLPAHALLWFEHAPSRLVFDATAQAPLPATIGWWLEVDAIIERSMATVTATEYSRTEGSAAEDSRTGDSRTGDAPTEDMPPADSPPERSPIEPSAIEARSFSTAASTANAVAPPKDLA